jgi:hypothetical protein
VNGHDPSRLTNRLGCHPPPPLNQEEIGGRGLAVQYRIGVPRPGFSCKQCHDLGGRGGTSTENNIHMSRGRKRGPIRGDAAVA